MAGEAISSLILFIAAMLVALGVAGTLVAGVGDLTGSLDSMSGSVSDEIDTDVEIISDPGSGAIVSDDGETVTLLVKNTGDRSLAGDGRQLDFVVNGQYVPRDDVSVDVYDSSVWRPGTVAEIELELGTDDSLELAEHRVRIAGSGVSASIEFYDGGEN
ncbi:flagellar protein G [Halovivax gelatinilyticus]|uniref:flagellar protein G n=1 Tax=Halovivax gelatinilyticus TaxID=2961597 RepID=UPI0020CA3EC8|nr:flagellar protein G [Halovivax gelatinilyticus]